MRDGRGSGRTERDKQFSEFVVDRRADLVHTAAMLTAGDAHLAEDLVQSVLTKLYVAWPAYQRADNPDGYVRRVLVNALTDERRRSWRRREHPVAEVPDRAGAEAPGSRVNETVRQALRDLPPRMRAALVFRFFFDLGVAETADALGCSEGTVKSQTSKALDRLRSVLPSPIPFLSQGAPK